MTDVLSALAVGQGSHATRVYHTHVWNLATGNRHKAMLTQLRLHGGRFREIEFAAQRLEFYGMCDSTHYLVQTERIKRTERKNSLYLKPISCGHGVYPSGQLYSNGRTWDLWLP